MEQQSDAVKRAVRTALRAIEAAETDRPTPESSEHIAAAIRQLEFAVDKLTDFMLRAKAGRN